MSFQTQVYPGFMFPTVDNLNK